MKTRVLVTGGNGFVATECIVQLLRQGFSVRATVRSEQKAQALRETLTSVMSDKNLDIEFVQADLTSDQNWDLAAQECQYVLHVASPISLQLPKDADEMIKPAVDGTLRVLKAAQAAGVARVVLTSNFGAVGYSQKDRSKLITEACWTDPNEKGLSAYNKSKVLAERAAWDYVQSNEVDLELNVVNPMGIFGPAIGTELSSGFGLLQQLMMGQMKRLPDIRLGIVDVRDVARLHILAMLEPAVSGERFLALSGGTLSITEIAVLLKKEFPFHTKKMSTKPLPTLLLKFLALFNKKAKSIRPLVGIYREASNAKARTMLGWQPRSNEEAILASAQSMIEHGVLAGTK